MKERPTDVYAEAFKLPRQQLDRSLGFLKDKIRQNIQTQNLVASLQQTVLQICALVENVIPDDCLEDDPFEAQSLQQQLDQISSRSFAKQNKRPAQAEQQPALLLHGEVNEEHIRQRVAKQTERELHIRQQKLTAKLRETDQIAQQPLRK